jgi:hypothetical protein
VAKYILSGDARDIPLAASMLLAMEQMFEQYKSEGGGGSSRPLPSYVRGQIYIKLYFEGLIINTTTRHRVEKLFRLVNDNPKTIGLNRLKLLAERTKDKFNNFSFKTGVHSYTYNSPEQGFNRVFSFFDSLTEAKRLFEQLLDITELSPDWKKLSHSSVPEPGGRFIDPPEKVTQANTLIRVERERPAANVKFKRAVIKFPHVRYEVDLVTDTGSTLSSLDFLKAYQD